MPTLPELLLAGRLAHRDGRLQVASPTPTGDPVQQEVTAAITSAGDGGGS